MFASTHEYTRAHWESTVPQKTQKSQITIDHRARRSKFEIRNSSRLASTHNSSISMNRLLRIIYLVLTGINLSNQSAQKQSSITMDIDDMHGERESSLASSLSLSLLSLSSSQLSSLSLSSSLCLSAPPTIALLQSSQYIFVFKTVCITIIVTVAITIVDIVIVIVIDINFLFLIIIAVLQFNSILTIMKWKKLPSI